jgi:hypothetical protein
MLGRGGYKTPSNACSAQPHSYPRMQALHLQYGQYLIAMGQRCEALNVASTVAAMHLGRADWNDAVGTLFTYCEEPARALSFFERASSPTMLTKWFEATRGAPGLALRVRSGATLGAAVEASGMNSSKCPIICVA